jgi:hypothetical protein
MTIFEIAAITAALLSCLLVAIVKIDLWLHRDDDITRD